PPRLERLGSGADGGIHILRRGTRKHPDQFATVCGIAIFKRKAARGFHPLAVNEVLENCRAHCGGHKLLRTFSRKRLLWEAFRATAQQGQRLGAHEAEQMAANLNLANTRESVKPTH